MSSSATSSSSRCLGLGFLSWDLHPDAPSLPSKELDKRRSRTTNCIKWICRTLRFSSCLNWEIFQLLELCEFQLLAFWIELLAFNWPQSNRTEMPVFYHRNFCANIIFLNQVNNKMRLNKTPEPLQTEAAVPRRKEFENPVKSHFYSNRLLRTILSKM